MKPSPLIQPTIEALCAHFQSHDEGMSVAVDLAVLVATADGVIDRAEMIAIAASLAAIAGTQLAVPVVRHLVRESREKLEAVGVEARARAIGEELAAHGSIDDGLRLALVIALASEGLCPVEREQIDMVAKAAGASMERVEALRREVEAAASR
jgi:hypothetical protein